MRDKVKVFDGIEETLITLGERGIAKGIITSRTREEFLVDFVPTGLAKYFDTVICADDTTKHKPDPEPMKKYIEITGCDPSKALYIGDTLNDMKCTDGTGVDFALALWGTRQKEEINAKYKIERPQQILDIINL